MGGKIRAAREHECIGGKTLVVEIVVRRVALRVESLEMSPHAIDGGIDIAGSRYAWAIDSAGQLIGDGTGTSPVSARMIQAAVVAASAASGMGARSSVGASRCTSKVR